MSVLSAMTETATDPLCTEGNRLISLALRDYHGDIVMLFMRAELPNLFCKGGKQGLRREVTMLPQGFDQALFSKFFSGIIERFGHAIGVEYESVSWEEMVLPNGAVPPLGQSQDIAVGFKPFDVATVPEEKGGGVTAIRVPQPLCVVVIFGKEESSVGALGRILVEKSVYGLQEAPWLIQRERREWAVPVGCGQVAQVRLQISHQESSSGSLSRDVADDQCEPASAEIKKVVVVAANVASLEAHTGVV
jgi:hypothetical protein